MIGPLQESRKENDGGTTSVKESINSGEDPSISNDFPITPEEQERMR